MSQPFASPGAVARALVPLAVAAVLPACSEVGSQPHGQMPPPEVAVVTVAPKTLPVRYEYVGQTSGSREVEVRARVNGILLKRNYQEGTTVKRGQSLFHHRPRAVPGRAREGRGRPGRRPRRARRRPRARPSGSSRCSTSEAVSQKEYDDAVSSAQITAAEVKSGAGAGGRSEAQPRLHARRGADHRHVEPLAPLRGHARLGPGGAAHQRDPGRPDLRELRDPRGRPARASGATSRRSACSCRQTSAST